jgi:hypothetical protein
MAERSLEMAMAISLKKHSAANANIEAEAK